MKRDFAGQALRQRNEVTRNVPGVDSSDSEEERGRGNRIRRTSSEVIRKYRHFFE